MNKPAFIEHPWERAGVITPGLPILPHGVERHPVPGGGSRAIPVFKGDKVSVLNKEGLQPAALVHFAPDRSSDAGRMGATGQGRPSAIIETLANGSPSGAKVLAALSKAGFDIAMGDGFSAFDEGAHAGDMADFSCEMDGLLLVAAPGGPMRPDCQDVPSELILYVQRHDPDMGKGNGGPPDPLADPLHDINIQPGQAKPYEVKKGEFIQILDVKGRECSDFQAFSARALDKA